MSPPRELELKLADAIKGISQSVDAEDAQVWRDQQGDIFAYCHKVGSQHWIRWPGLAGYCLDVSANQIAAHPEPNADPSLILDTYQRSILPIVQHVLGRESLHASAVQGPEGVVALCGESMSGKSTIAYGLSERGYALWADDSVVLDISDQSATAIPFPFSMRLRSTASLQFGLAAERLAQPIGEQESNEPERHSAPLAAIFVLGRLPDDGSETGVEVLRLKDHEALTQLLPHARCFSLKDLERKRQMMRNYMTLVDRVPVFTIRFKAGFNQLPEILDQIERSADMACEAP